MSNRVELWRPNCTRVCSNCCRSKCICPKKPKKPKSLKRSRYSNITDEEAEVMFDKGFDEGMENAILWYPDNTRWTL